MATLRTAVSTMPLRTLLPKKSLTQSLTTPSKVAQMFDWKKASSNNLLTLHITKQTIECAIASHPTAAKNASSPIQALPSIPLTRDVTRNDTTAKYGQSPPASFHVPSATKALQEVIQQYNVCGIVVVYPTNTENGAKNAACGRALHVLDHLSLTGGHHNHCGGTATKPICLYDPNAHFHHSENVGPDEWGRSALDCTTTTAKVVHCAKQPHSETNLLQQTWDNFVHQYWPSVSTTPTYDFDDFNDLEDEDLSDFMAKLNKNHQNHRTIASFQMNMEHKKKDLVYQSAC